MVKLSELRPSFLRNAMPTRKSPRAVLGELWQISDFSDETLGWVDLNGTDPVFPSSFAVGTAAQVTIAAAALAATEIGVMRGLARQRVAVDMKHAAQECRSFFTVDGVAHGIHDRITGMYSCGDGGWVRIHANFAHHRDGALAILGLPIGDQTTREQVENALTGWGALDFESVAAEEGMVVAAARSFEQWDRHPQGQAIATQPLLTIERLGDAAARPLPAYERGSRPLSDIRVLDLTRIIAGPVCGRALAAYGADVMLLNSPQLPNIDTIVETSRGKLSAFADLHTADGRIALSNLLKSARIFVQGYRPGGLDDLGFGPREVARMRPGIVYVSLSAYGTVGPWANRRGFDSLVQMASGLNVAEGLAAHSNAPKTLPMQILDHASGYLMAYGAQVALAKQASEGGSWHVRVSLAQTAHWLRSLGRVPNGLNVSMPSLDKVLETTPSGYGRLTAVKHSAILSATPARWTRPSSRPGTHPTIWPSP
jgi:crotonobetainyl-CoA:carnitine CoA-transferase CaiB-like acyl-CoA transferase